MISIFIFPLFLIFEVSLFILIHFILSLINKPYILEKKEILRNIKIFVFSFITLILILWRCAQFIFFGATFKFSFLAFIALFAILFIIYFSKKDFCPFYILFLQIFLYFLFVSIGNSGVARDEKFLRKSDIVYYGKQTISEVTNNSSKIITNPLDIYYFSDYNTNLEKSFNSNDYSIEIYYDVHDTHEYYEICEQKLWQQLYGLGCQYDISYGKYLIKLHIKN